jgi:hypothetical protein
VAAGGVGFGFVDGWWKGAHMNFKLINECL